jgi:hypothetical protein
LPPIMIGLPHPGPEPLNVAAPPTTPPYSGVVPPTPSRPAASDAGLSPQTSVAFSDRWQDPSATASTSQVPRLGHPQSTAADAMLGFSAGITPGQLLKMPQWPLQDARN